MKETDRIFDGLVIAALVGMLLFVLCATNHYRNVNDWDIKVTNKDGCVQEYIAVKCYILGDIFIWKDAEVNKGKFNLVLVPGQFESVEIREHKRIQK